MAARARAATSRTRPSFRWRLADHRSCRKTPRHHQIRRVRLLRKPGRPLVMGKGVQVMSRDVLQMMICLQFCPQSTQANPHHKQQTFSISGLQDVSNNRNATNACIFTLGAPLPLPVALACFGSNDEGLSDVGISFRSW